MSQNAKTEQFQNEIAGCPERVRCYIAALEAQIAATPDKTPAAATDDAEAKKRAQWLYDHNAPKNWIIVTTEEIAALKRAYRPLTAAANGWLDIQSAPRDGTHVKVLYPYSAKWIEAWYDDRLSGWYAVKGFVETIERISPTHWQLLPSADLTSPATGNGDEAGQPGAGGGILSAIEKATLTTPTETIMQTFRRVLADEDLNLAAAPIAREIVERVWISLSAPGASLAASSNTNTGHNQSQHPQGEGQDNLARLNPGSNPGAATPLAKEPAQGGAIVAMWAENGHMKACLAAQSAAIEKAEKALEDATERHAFSQEGHRSTKAALASLREVRGKA